MTPGGEHGAREPGRLGLALEVRDVLVDVLRRVRLHAVLRLIRSRDELYRRKKTTTVRNMRTRVNPAANVRQVLPGRGPLADAAEV
jgi:hypothetical protein